MNWNYGKEKVEYKSQQNKTETGMLNYTEDKMQYPILLGILDDRSQILKLLSQQPKQQDSSNKSQKQKKNLIEKHLKREG